MFERSRSRGKHKSLWAELSTIGEEFVEFLEDVVENWIFTSMNGNPFLIPHARDQFIRPFLTTEKSALTLWCVRKGVPTIDDPSNDDTKYRRNYIRHKMMPHVLTINPGIRKTIKKKILDSL